MHDMQHAFEHCFDAYKSCGVYRDLLAERQARRAAGATTAAGGVRFLWATACTSPATVPAAEAASDVSQKAADSPSAAAQPAPSGPTPGRMQFVQLRLPGNIAAAAAVSAAAAATLALAAQ
jgi:hypothetical protein